MASERTWQNQFINWKIPKKILGLVESGKLVDTSWGNNVCPSFTSKDGSILLWVDHHDTFQRELTKSKRFSIQVLDREGNPVGFSIETNSIVELMRFMDGQYGIK